MNLYKIICEYLDLDKIGILATVIKRTGSAPRDVGAKMFVGEDGKAFGTVGGGLLENKTYKEALAIMGRNVIKTFNVSMNAEDIRAKDMICGGDVTILLEPVTTKHRDVYRQIEAIKKNKQKGLIVTSFSSGVLTKTLFDEVGNITGDEPDQRIIDQIRMLPRLKTFLSTEEYFLEPIGQYLRLYLFGAGHVSQYVAQIAKIADFDVSIIDDRKEFANHERFPNADAIIVANIQDSFYCLDFTGDEYVVIASRSHEYDAQILEEALDKQARYIGMIGSKRKIKIITDSIRKKGYDDTVIESIHTPIGIPINAETPQEIAVSIVAELIKVKNSTQTEQAGSDT